MGVLATIIELGSDSTLYGILLFLHIICAILGFGSLALNGLYGQQAAQRKGPEGVAIGQANMAVSKVAEIFVYGVFVFGILLVLTAENDLIGFEDLWVWLSILLFVIALGFSHARQIPNARKMNALAAELATHRGATAGTGRPASAGRADGGPRQAAGRGRDVPQPDAAGDPLPDDLQARLPSRRCAQQPGVDPRGGPDLLSAATPSIHVRVTMPMLGRLLKRTWGAVARSMPTPLDR